MHKNDVEAHPIREYTRGEEIANSITHGVGAGLSIAALVILIVCAIHGGGGVKLFAGIFFGVTLILEYTMSTLYHAITNETAKRVFKVLDHSSIYLLIAGTYAPFCLVSMGSDGGWALFFIVSGLALVGVAFEAFWVFRPRWVNAVIYLLMGWGIAFKFGALLAAIPSGGVALLIAGGVCYTVGCVFYVLKKVPYMHAVWHLWVLGGSICHFLAVVLYVM